MKIRIIKTISILILLFNAATNLLATPPLNSPFWQDYIDKRFIENNFSDGSNSNGETLIVDLKNVDIIMVDQSGHFRKFNAPQATQSLAGDNYTWLKTKSGTLHHFDRNLNIVTAWRNYKAFLKLHPEFLFIP